ncbi:MAG: hypothetical protein Q8Q48_03050 [Candidatus Staskawiczbacteria bacterium]|nr:hypothetical protein [Candidatus Staskawiczbacteria bacterium]
MKWCLLINNAQFTAEFFAKLSEEITERGDTCLVVFNSKTAEFNKKSLFASGVRFVSMVDWCFENYQPDKEEFGGLSWQDFFCIFDRYKALNFNYGNSFKIISQNYQFFEFLFDNEKPDVIVSESPAGLFHQVARYFCKKNNTPYLGLGGSRFDNRIDVYDSVFTYSKYEEYFSNLEGKNLSETEKDFSENFIKKFVSHEKLPPYMDFVKVNFSQAGLFWHYVLKVKELGMLFKCFMAFRLYKSFDYETAIILKKSLTAPVLAEIRQFRILSQRKVFNDFKGNERYFLFPLQFQPEASTSVFAAYYNDQLSTIKNIAFSIPFPYMLYVKEHPAAIGLRPTAYYKKLKELPNVVLISPSANTESLIRNSLGVIALTSTVGLEAILSGKRVYVLGNVFYSYHPLCRKLRNFEELKDKIQEDLISKSESDNLENINNRFITSYFKGTIEGSITSSSLVNDNNNYKSIYEHLKKILENLSNGNS